MKRRDTSHVPSPRLCGERVRVRGSSRRTCEPASSRRGKNESIGSKPGERWISDMNERLRQFCALVISTALVAISTTSRAEEDVAPVKRAAVQVDSVITEAPITDDDREHWAFRPIVRASLPNVITTEWPRNGIDAFILSRLEQQGLSPAPDADRATLFRRLSGPAGGETTPCIGDGATIRRERLGASASSKSSLRAMSQDCSKRRALRCAPGWTTVAQV